MFFKQDRRRYRGTIERMRPTFKTRSGQTLRARLLQPKDAPLLLDLYHQLSPESRGGGFHGSVDNLPPEALTQGTIDLANVDNLTARGAVVATLRNERGEEEIVAVARLARPLGAPDAPVAEAAIVVRDDFQGQGVGSELLRRLVLLAKRMQIQTMLAMFNSYNEGAIQLFRELNLPYTVEIEHGETEMRIEMPQ